MKAILEFDLKEDADRYEYDIFKQSMMLHRFVGEFKEYLRTQYKYTELTQEQSDYLDKIRDEFYKIAGDYNINFDDL